MWLEQILGMQLSAYLFPMCRIAGLVMAAPVFGSRLVPVRIKAALVASATFVVAPTLPPMAFDGGWFLAGLIVIQETLIGVAMAMIVQMMFDALVIGGQTIAMTMGLGFAMLIDPQRGVSVPVLSQFFIIIGVLVFLSLDGHLAMLRMLVDSFTVLPIGEILSAQSVWWLVEWGASMFVGAVSVALPAVISILVINIAFGVMSRAAPTLNLFAIGFPSALLFGFLILLMNMNTIVSVFSGLVGSSLESAAGMLAP